MPSPSLQGLCRGQNHARHPCAALPRHPRSKFLWGWVFLPMLQGICSSSIKFPSYILRYFLYQVISVLLFVEKFCIVWKSILCLLWMRLPFFHLPFNLMFCLRFCLVIPLFNFFSHSWTSSAPGSLLSLSLLFFTFDVCTSTSQYKFQTWLKDISSCTPVCYTELQTTHVTSSSQIHSPSVFSIFISSTPL